MIIFSNMLSLGFLTCLIGLCFLFGKDVSINCLGFRDILWRVSRFWSFCHVLGRICACVSCTLWRRTGLSTGRRRSRGRFWGKVGMKWAKGGMMWGNYWVMWGLGVCLVCKIGWGCWIRLILLLILQSIRIYCWCRWLVSSECWCHWRNTSYRADWK